MIQIVVSFSNEWKFLMLHVICVFIYQRIWIPNYNAFIYFAWQIRL